MPTGASSNCPKCPALCQSRTQPVNGQGAFGGIFVVSQVPGYYEDRDNEPMLGRNGKLFRLICDEAGMPRNILFKSFAVRCMTPDGRKPKKAEVVNCREFLIAEIRKQLPKIIVTLGDSPLQALYGIDRNRNTYNDELAIWESDVSELIEAYRLEVEAWAALPRKGRPLKPKRPKSPLKPKKPKDENTTIGSVCGHTLIQPDTGIPMIATYAPGFLMRGKWNYTDIVIAHFKKAMRIYTGEQGIPTSD